GQALRDRDRGRRGPARDADLRRRRLHGRHAREPLLPRRQGPRDRRGHQRDPAHRHRTRARTARPVTSSAPHDRPARGARRMAEPRLVDRAARAGTVTHPSLKDSAAAYLREQILTGRLVPGAKGDQAEISEALGMSRLPVREALIELAHESLIDAVPRRGAFVARLDRADILDHYRIFGLIAGLAASRAATALTEAQLADLRDVHESFVAATDPD